MIKIIDKLNMDKSGIYLIKNTTNNKCYVGLTRVSFDKRLKEHISYLSNYDPNFHSLHRSYKEEFIKDWREFNGDNFEFHILKILKDNLPEYRARIYESINIIRYKSYLCGYNNSIRSSNEKITVRYDVYGKNPKIIYFKNSKMHQCAFRNKDGVGRSLSNFEYYYVEFPMNYLLNIPQNIPIIKDPRKLVIYLIDKDFNIKYKTSNRDKLFNKIKEMGWNVPLEKKRLATPIRTFTFCNAQYFMIREYDLSRFIDYIKNKRKDPNFKYSINSDVEKLVKEIV